MFYFDVPRILTIIQISFEILSSQGGGKQFSPIFEFRIIFSRGEKDQPILLKYQGRHDSLTLCEWWTWCLKRNSYNRRRALQRLIGVVQKLIFCLLPSLEAISNSRCCISAENLMKDGLHPGYHLFDLLPSRRCFRSSCDVKDNCSE